jgi:hypothetical protein
MLDASPVRLFRRVLPVLSLAVFYGCSDAPTPLQPRLDTRPHALLAPEVIVSNTDDAGAGSLRQTIADAAAGSVIHFDASIAGKTIVLSTGQIQIDKSLTIEGPVPAGITISGGLSSRLFVIASTGNVTFRNVAIVNGSDQTGSGAGAVFLIGTALMDHVLLANNQSDFTGGAVFVKSTGQLTLVNSTVSGNVSVQGGGINSNGTVTIWNSTITNNASANGGGIVVSEGNVYLRNSIIANNNGSDGPFDSNCSVGSNAVLLYSGTNLSNDGSCGSAPNMVIADPKLGPLADNGGPTKTHALGATSPAIDGGTLCTETTDQRYVTRNQGTTCDVGAFEFNSFATVALTFGPNVALDTKTGSAVFAGTIACSAPGLIELTINVSQTQKTTGRFPTIVTATGGLTVPCTTGASSWSAAMSSGNGKFQNGSATGIVTTKTVPQGFLPATVTTTLKLFQVK